MDKTKKKADVQRLAKVKSLVKKYQELLRGHDSNYIERVRVLMSLIYMKGWVDLRLSSPLELVYRLNPGHSAAVCKALLTVSQVCIYDKRWLEAMRKYEVSGSHVALCAFLLEFNDLRPSSMWLEAAKTMGVHAFRMWINAQRQSRSRLGEDIVMGEEMPHVFHIRASPEVTHMFLELVDWCPTRSDSGRKRVTQYETFERIVRIVYKDAQEGKLDFAPKRIARKRRTKQLAAKAAAHRKGKLRQMHGKIDD